MMVRSAVTISLVEEARGGPFVFHGSLEDACRQAAELGFDAIELFAPSAAAIQDLPLRRLLAEYHLRLAAVGTGAGMVRHGLHLCDPDADRRQAAERFIADIIEAAAVVDAPAIIGSMQGRWEAAEGRDAAVGRLRAAMERLGARAAGHGQKLIYEPLNRYETNVAVTLEQGMQLLDPLPDEHVVLLADLFHMNIEEADPAQALRRAGQRVGHVHFVDSNRQAAGRGHLNFHAIADALRDIGYGGYASAEAFPVPDSRTAAAQTMEMFCGVFR